MAKACFHSTLGGSLFGMALFLATGAASAAETGPDIAPTVTSSWTSPTARDLQVVLRVRRALLADDEIGPLNVGISVRDGVATLWGPLLTSDQIRRALLTVRDVRGVQSVRNELYLAKDTRPLPPIFVLPERMPSQVPPTDALVSADRTGTLAKLDRTNRRTPDETGPTALPEPRNAALLAPVPLEAGQEQPTMVTTARAEGVPAAIDRIQKSDARFGQIGLDWHEGTIVLHGNRNDAAAVMAFARRLSDVPGVERVVLQSPKKVQP